MARRTPLRAPSARLRNATREPSVPQPNRPKKRQRAAAMPTTEAVDRQHAARILATLSATVTRDRNRPLSEGLPDVEFFNRRNDLEAAIERHRIEEEVERRRREGDIEADWVQDDKDEDEDELPELPEDPYNEDEDQLGPSQSQLGAPTQENQHRRIRLTTGTANLPTPPSSVNRRRVRPTPAIAVVPVVVPDVDLTLPPLPTVYQIQVKVLTNKLERASDSRSVSTQSAEWQFTDLQLFSLQMLRDEVLGYRPIDYKFIKYAVSLSVSREKDTPYSIRVEEDFVRVQDEIDQVALRFSNKPRPIKLIIKAEYETVTTPSSSQQSSQLPSSAIGSRRRVTATSRQEDEAPDRQEEAEQGGSFLTAIIGRWRCVDTKCFHCGKGECWRDSSNQHFHLTHNQEAAWSLLLSANNGETITKLPESILSQFKGHHSRLNGETDAKYKERIGEGLAQHSVRQEGSVVNIYSGAPPIGIQPPVPATVAIAAIVATAPPSSPPNSETEEAILVAEFWEWKIRKMGESRRVMVQTEALKFEEECYSLPQMKAYQYANAGKAIQNPLNIKFGIFDSLSRDIGAFTRQRGRAITPAT